MTITREDCRLALARYLGNKILQRSGSDFDEFRRRSGDVACNRFFAEADIIISALEMDGLEFEDEEHLLDTPASKPKGGKK